MRPCFAAVQARPDELGPAFQLIFQSSIEEDRLARTLNAQRLIRQGELDPKGVWVVRDQTELLGALVCLLVPGASGLVWPPQAIAHAHRDEIEDQLLRSALSWLRQRGAKLAQSLLSQAERPLSVPLERNGLAHITSLRYLRHQLGFPPELLAEQRRLEYENYTSCDRDTFHRTLLRTYVGTLDCPEVNGVRDLNEVIQGHQAQGVFDAGRWWLARESGLPVGVLLLTEVLEWQGWDISYLGVVPEARGKGVGKELTRKALRETQAAGGAQLTLAVDERNGPAQNLYEDLGFEPFDQREVYLAIW
jgi:ribosomal protein S18 acetylase RimI-like enzyme